jgi:hypothetical protein
MAASINSSPVHHERDLVGQTILVIGGSSGIGLETARLARAQGAGIILTARDPDRLHRAGIELGASIAAFDATDFGRLERFFDALPAPIDHLLVTGPVPTARRWPSSTSTRPAATSTPISCCRYRSPGTPQPRSAREAPCCSWGAPAAAARRRAARHRGAHGRAARPDQDPRARGRARPGQPDRGRVCRHAAVGLPARRPDRPAPRAAACHAADRPRRRPGRHRRPGCPPHDEHRDHRRDLRHRRRPATPRRVSAGYRDENAAQIAGSDRTPVAARMSPPRGSPRPRQSALHAQNVNSEPSARSLSALGPPLRTAATCALHHGQQPREVIALSTIGSSAWSPLGRFS